jgi:hypothetical protein
MWNETQMVKITHNTMEDPVKDGWLWKWAGEAYM